MKNITIKQLRAFITVARERNFTRAASLLGLSQSALTIAIRQLEQEIRLRLFDRSTRSVQLTAHASAFLPVAERLLDDLSRALDDLDAVAARQKGTVSVAASASFLCSILAPTVAALARQYPGIRVRLLNTPEHLARRVLEEEIDFGIASIRQPVQTLESHLLLEDRFGIVCPARHPLALKRAALDWSDLRKQPLVGMAAGTSIREILERDDTAAEVLENPACEASSVFALGALISNGMGLAVLPALSARPILTKNLVFRPLQRPVKKRELFLIKRRGRSLSPAATAVTGLMMAELEKACRDPHVSTQPAVAFMQDFGAPA